MEPSTAQSAEALELSGGVRVSGVSVREVAAVEWSNGNRHRTLSPDEAHAYLPAKHFCSSLAEALCGQLSACGCGDDKAACYESIDVDCNGRYGMMGPEVLDAVSEDRLLYDGYAAFRFVDRLAQGAVECQGPIESLAWNHGALVTFGDVFLGYVRPGDECKLPSAPFRANECYDGVCRLDEKGAGKCVPTVGLGEPCHDDAICVDEQRPLEMRHFFDGSLQGYCAPVEGGERFCQPRGKTGSSCRAHEGCESGRCFDKRCAPRAEVGEWCAIGLDCAEGYCAEGSCVAPNLPLDSECQRHEQCASGACYQGNCGEAICRR